MYNVIFSIPKSLVDLAIKVASDAGAGKIGEYTQCAFLTDGLGRWVASKNANPHIGNKEEVVEIPETKVEMICEETYLSDVIQAIKRVHPYETPAILVNKVDELHI